jgi:hypothetical protein
MVVGLGLVRAYLGVDHPTDVLFAALLGVAVPVTLFRAFASSHSKFIAAVLAPLTPLPCA